MGYCDVTLDVIAAIVQTTTSFGCKYHYLEKFSSLRYCRGWPNTYVSEVVSLACVTFSQAFTALSNGFLAFFHKTSNCSYCFQHYVGYA